jgi:hypothetical protein
LTYLGDHTKNPEKSLLNNSIIRTSSLNNYYYLLNMKKVNVRMYHKCIPNQLGYYLAGLIEGDGSIILRKGDQEKISPKIVFTFSVNELKMYKNLKEILKTGSIYEEKEGVNRYSSGTEVKKVGVCRYIITNVDAVIAVINLVNGKFRTPKISALHKVIDNLNK